MLRNAIIGGVATVFVIASAAEITMPPRPVWLYNPSASAPVGWYKIDKRDEFKTGDQVAAYAPDWARKLASERDYLPYKYPLIKTIWAESGVTVCYEKGALRVPNRPVLQILEQDGLGRELPVIEGCFTLTEDRYLLISPDVQTAFDGRYFGPVPKRNILGRVNYLGKSIGERFGSREEIRKEVK